VQEVYTHSFQRRTLKEKDEKVNPYSSSPTFCKKESPPNAYRWAF